MVAKVLDDLVHVWFHRPHARDSVVTHDGALQPRMFDIVRLTKHVVGNSSIHDRAAVLIKVGLWDMARSCQNSSRFVRVMVVHYTFFHLPSVL